MCFKHILLLCFILLSASEFAFSQQVPIKKDSTHLYENIESFSKRRHFTKFMYQIFFKPVNADPTKKKATKKVYKKLIQKPYSAFEGKPIRNINIETLDPFGYSVTDIRVKPNNKIAKGGNGMHIKSQTLTIRNLLLIRQNQLFDSLLVKESERLVRAGGYIRDVSFFVKSASTNSDSVDIFIRELDRWSLISKGLVSLSKFNVSILDRNFLGFGHEFYNGVTKFYNTNDVAYNTNYYIPNIRNTYINSTLHYGTDEYRNFSRSFAVDRPFFSPYARWAAGASFKHISRNDSIKDNNSVFIAQHFLYNTQDYWAGNAIRIFKGNTENYRTTNFISTLRLLRVRYQEKPIEAIDTLNIYANENLYLAGVGISRRKYVQDAYIFKFGITEDVPVGEFFSFTGGFQDKSNTVRLYLGAKVAYGYYYSWGYLSSNFEYGTFFRASHAQQGVITAGVNYFTGLIETGKWKFRHFIKTQVTFGLNRFAYDSLTLNDGYGIDGFSSPVLSGTSRLLFTMQTQSYSPWNFVGFRFGPFITFSLGMLGNATTGFANSNLYSQIALGVLIKNEHLIINSFQISIAFYPVIPGKADNIFKMNSFRTSDFGFRDFEIGKPVTTVFQ